MATPDSTAAVYKDIPGFPGYRISDDGVVISCWNRVWPSNITHRMKAGETAWAMTGQWWVVRPKLVREKGKLNIEIAGKSMFVHRLVLMAFVGPCPPGMMCCHANGVGTDNRLANLRWDTPKANADDRERHGRTVKGSKVCGSKLTPAVVRQIRRDHTEKKHSQRDLARIHGVSQASIYSIVHRKTWKHITDEPEAGQESG